MKNITFNCNQTSKNGLGHFFRCINLAKHISSSFNYKIVFIGNYSSFSKKILKKNKFVFFGSTSKKTIDEYISNTDILITDRYDINQEYLNFLSLKTHIKKVFIDDFNLLDYSGQDLVVNFRVGVSDYKYKSKKSLLGPNYFIYDPNLVDVQKNFCFSDKVNSVLLYGTATNIKNSLFNKIPEILLNKFDDIVITHLVNDKIPFRHHRYKQINFTKNISNFLKNSDIIINGGGLIKYESAFCGIPAASLSTTFDQHQDTIILEKNNLLFNLGYIEESDIESISKNLEDFISNSKIRNAINRNCKKIFTKDSINNLIKNINEL